MTLLVASLSLFHFLFLVSCPCLLSDSPRHLSFVKVLWLNGKMTKWPLRKKHNSLGEIRRGLIHGSSFRCLSIVRMSKKTEVDYVLIRFTVHAGHYIIFNSDLSYRHAVVVWPPLY
jgi:hypothetical protein